jgi:hypothetical protein
MSTNPTSSPEQWTMSSSTLVPRDDSEYQKIATELEKALEKAFESAERKGSHRDHIPFWKT